MSGFVFSPLTRQRSRGLRASSGTCQTGRLRFSLKATAKPSSDSNGRFAGDPPEHGSTRFKQSSLHRPDEPAVSPCVETHCRDQTGYRHSTDCRGAEIEDSSRPGLSQAWHPLLRHHDPAPRPRRLQPDPRLADGPLRAGGHRSRHRHREPRLHPGWGRGRSAESGVRPCAQARAAALEEPARDLLARVRYRLARASRGRGRTGSAGADCGRCDGDGWHCQGHRELGPRRSEASFAAWRFSSSSRFSMGARDWMASASSASCSISAWMRL